MNQVFLYLYPIEEYIKMFIYPDDNLYDEWKVERPLPILNECIQKRYRNNAYQVVFALYPDKKIYGIDVQKEDKIIFTDVLFEQASACDNQGTIKSNFIPKYPNERQLIEQLGNVNKLVIGGYHFSDCTKKVGEAALTMGIDTMIDLDLTDLFFSLYRQKEYFNVEQYNPKRYQEHWYQVALEEGEQKSL